jgi:hypothetical protein
MQGLLAFAETTEEMDLAASTDPGEVVQLCAPARALLLRIADGCIEGLAASDR